MVKEFDFKKFITTSNEWEFEVEGQKFTCEETDLGDEADLFNFYIDPDGKENIAKLRMVQATKIKKSPFNKEWIEYVFAKYYPEETLSKDVSWITLPVRAKLAFFAKLDSNFMSAIMNNIGNHYISKEVTVKN